MSHASDIFALDPLMYTSYQPRSQGPSMCILVGIAAVSVLLMSYAQQQCYSYYPRLHKQGVMGMLAEVADVIKKGGNEVAIDDEKADKAANTEKVKTAIDKTTNAVVIIYAPWCGHCQQMLPTLEGIRSKYPKCNLIRINADSVDQAVLFQDPATRILDLQYYPSCCKVVDDGANGKTLELIGPDAEKAFQAAQKAFQVGDPSAGGDADNTLPVSGKIANVLHPHKRPMEANVDFGNDNSSFAPDDQAFTQNMLNQFF